MISSYILRSVFVKRSTLLNNFLMKVCPKPLFFHVSNLLNNGYKIEIKMPALSPTMTEGTIVQWLKKEGDEVVPGDVLCEIQTDKAVVGLETEEEGTLDKILMPENTKNVQLGEIIAIILGEGEPVERPKDNLSTEQPKETPKIANYDVSQLIGPAVKKLLQEFNIKDSDVTVSGPKHNLLKGDVLKFIKDHNLKIVKNIEKIPTKPKQPVVSLEGTYVDIPVGSLKSELAQKLIESKNTVSHGYMSADCKIDNLFLCLEKFHKEGVAVSLNSFIVKSVAVTLKRVSALNISNINGQLQHSDIINILITDVTEEECKTYYIKNAGSLKLSSIANQIEDSSSDVSEPSGNMFRISNLSSLGVTDIAEIISPNDVAILTISGIKCGFEKSSPVKQLRATLSFDCYHVTETDAGMFLETFKHFLENPPSILCYD